MSINFKLIEAIQAVAEVGKTIEHLENIIQGQEQDVNHWRNTANELERKLESAEKACANEADSCDKIEAKLVETLKVNENLRVARNEVCTNYEKVCAELRGLQEEYAEMTTTVEELNAKIKELTNADKKI